MVKEKGYKEEVVLSLLSLSAFNTCSRTKSLKWWQSSGPMRLQVGRQKPTHWENGKEDEKIQGPYWLTNFYLSPDFLRKQSLPWWLSHCWFDFVPCRWKHASLTATKAQNVNEVILTSLTFPARFELISYQVTGAWALKWKTKTNLKKKKKDRLSIVNAIEAIEIEIQVTLLLVVGSVEE